MHICHEEILPAILYLGPIATMLWFSVRARVRRWLGHNQHTNCDHHKHHEHTERP